MLINGERVRQARELKGLTQATLAKLVGVSQAAIAQIESGAFMASEELAAEIAKRTSQPISFFQQDPAREFDVGSLLFRSHASMTKREMTEAYRHGQLAYDLYMQLRKHARDLPVKIKTVSHRSPVSAANDTRIALGLDLSGPIPHLLNVLEWHGAIAVVIPAAPSRDAFSSWEEERPVIAIADGRPGDRVRMSVSHELGHLVMHKGMSRFLVDDAEADEFAAEFLMPSEAILREIKAPVTLSSLAALKPRWRVSIQSLIRRAKDIEVISDRQYRYLFEQLSAVGWRKKEPIEIVPERPRAFRQMAELVYGDPVDATTMAEDLSVRPEFLRETLALYAAKVENSLPSASTKIVQLPKRKINTQ